jgi:hypothetical protein
MFGRGDGAVRRHPRPTFPIGARIVTHRNLRFLLLEVDVRSEMLAFEPFRAMNRNDRVHPVWLRSCASSSSV